MKKALLLSFILATTSPSSVFAKTKCKKGTIQNSCSPFKGSKKEFVCTRGKVSKEKIEKFCKRSR